MPDFRGLWPACTSDCYRLMAFEPPQQLCPPEPSLPLSSTLTTSASVALDGLGPSVTVRSQSSQQLSTPTGLLDLRLTRSAEGVAQQDPISGRYEAPPVA
ncbi:unnamed protein product, partial [Protopolystoma xenopodis]